MQDASSKQQTKQKYKPNHQQTGLPSHSALPIRGKTKKKTKARHKSHPIGSSHKTLRAETNRKKEFNLFHGKNSTFLGAWERRPQTQELKKNNNEKAEKYYPNEGTNLKHRNSNK